MTRPPQVPLFASDHDSYKPRVLERLGAVLEGGRYILGPEVTAFEEEFARHLGVRHCVGVANGTDAITIGLRALGVRPGDEVVIPSFTFYATAEATVNAGAVPVFCDIDPDTFCVTAAAVERVLTPRTRAIVPVHLFGNLAPVDELRGFGLPIFEDAAQAAGARLAGRAAGALGDAASFSFFPSKNLFCFGDGGAITTDDDEIALRARRLRFHGSDDKVTFVDVGYNSRLDELQAAALRVLLPELDGWNAARRAAADAYARGGLGELVTLQAASSEAEPVHHLFVVRHERADELRETLAAAGIGARAYYRRPAHLQPAMSRWAADAGSLPGTDEAARTHLALPMGTALGEDEVVRVVAAVRAALA